MLDARARNGALGRLLSEARRLNIQGNAVGITAHRTLLGEHRHDTDAVLNSVAWEAFGHGDVVFIVAGDWNPATGKIHHGVYADLRTSSQSLSEDNSPVEPLAIPAGGTLRFYAKAATGADSAAFSAEIRELPTP